jgi:TonB dependent receptor-like, beta-barrel/Carboxypeptidase regulatory-like domain/TonB-dependent Receptor Plug Domain
MLCGGGPRLACLLFAVGGLAVTRPLAAQEVPPGPARGAIRGSVVDKTTAQPIIGAHVEVVGSEETARTDVDGRFDILLPPGTYQLRVSAPLYEATRLDNVVAQPGAPARISVSLTAKVDTSVEIVEVIADVTAATEATQLLKRKMAPTVSDNLGAEMISKTPDTDAAEVVTRVPAVTIRDDKFIVVRGLSERYSSALLNGSRLPSTDPDRRIVPLDLFPADFIESISIVKSYSPDLPGDFSGGLVEISLADPPSHFTYSLGASTGINTATTFQSFNTYDGTSADWFTLGDDFRNLPDNFPDRVGATTTPQMQTLVGSLRNNWNIDSTTAPPNFGLDGSVGGALGPFSAYLAAQYGTKHQVHRDEIVSSFTNPQNLDDDKPNRFLYDRSDFDAQIGALLTTAYKISPNHKLTGRALFNRKAVDEVLFGDGVDEFDFSQRLFVRKEAYQVDQLGFGQLAGRHHFSLFDVDWRASWAPSLKSTPDTKFLLYQAACADDEIVNGVCQSTAQPPMFYDKAPSTQRVFGTLNEFVQDYYLDVTTPFATGLPFTDVWSGLNADFKSGVAYSLRDRDFSLRRFSTTIANAMGRVDLTQPPETLLVPENYSTSGPFVFTEDTRTSDGFKATHEIAAAYGMFELPLIRDMLRFVGGARLEYSYLKTEGFALGGEPFKDFLNDLDPLPGVSLIYTPREDMNVRLAYSQTVSRPELRELTPTRFPVAPGEPTLAGSPLLVSASTTNYDLRWEWFFNPLELASVGFFYKQIKDPIELVRIAVTSEIADGFINADDATVWGFELEGRKNFNFLVPYARRWEPLRGLAPHLADVQLNTNVAVIESEVTLPNSTRFGDFVIAPTNRKRALVGQAPYVINIALDYEHFRWGLFRLLYNIVGETVKAGGSNISMEGAGTEGLPDIFTQPRNQLDFVWITEIAPFGTPVKAKFAVENILNDDFLVTQGGKTLNKYQTGQTFSFKLVYTY